MSSKKRVFITSTITVPAGAVIFFSDGRVGTVPESTIATPHHDMGPAGADGTLTGTRFSFLDPTGIPLGLGTITSKDGEPLVVEVREIEPEFHPGAPKKTPRRWPGWIRRKS